MNFKNRAKKYKEQIKIDSSSYNFDHPVLDTINSYILSKNNAIHRTGLYNLNKLLNTLDESIFAKDNLRLEKFKFAKEALKIKLEKRLSNRDLILSELRMNMDVDWIIDNPKYLHEVATEEVYWIEGLIGTCLNNIYIDSNIMQWKLAVEEYENANYKDKTKYATNIREKMKECMTQFRKNDIDNDAINTEFRLSELDSSLPDIHKQITRPSFKLATGMMGLNGMLAGGFEGGRVYGYFGLSGEGKTLSLVNTLWQIRKYNSKYECKDKTKKPCIVLLTMENFVREVVCALYEIICRTNELREVSIDEALENFKKNGFKITTENPIDIVIKFKPINSVDTNYLYNITDRLEDEGYEVIAFLEDYVKRIRPVDRVGDSYEDYGAIINEFKTFATLKQIPVITASQLNREAIKAIEEARASNKKDLLNRISKANIGESVKIDENIDCTILIVPVIDNNGNKWMGMKLAKHRYKIYTQQTMLYQPFYQGSEISMYCDVYDTKPAFRESLARDSEEMMQAFGDVDRFSITKTVKSLENLDNHKSNVISTSVNGLNNISSFIPEKAKLKTVVEVIPQDQREKLREKYGITKAV